MNVVSLRFVPKMVPELDEPTWSQLLQAVSTFHKTYGQNGYHVEFNFEVKKHVKMISQMRNNYQKCEERCNR